MGRRHVGSVVHPAMPARRYGRRLGIAVIHHPAALLDRLGKRGLGAVVLVAELIGADIVSLPPRVKPCVQRLAVPPREELLQE